MTNRSRLYRALMFAILVLAAGLATLALLTSANAARAQDADSANPSEAAIPMAKCTGLEACGGINPNLVADGSCNGDYACYVASGHANASAESSRKPAADAALGAPACRRLLGFAKVPSTRKLGKW